MDGKTLYQFPVAGEILPYIKVIRSKSGGGSGDSGDKDEDVSERTSSRQKRRAKKKAKRGAEGEVVENNPQEGESSAKRDEMEVDDETAECNNQGASNAPAPPLLAVQKIIAEEFGSQRSLVFSAYG